MQAYWLERPLASVTKRGGPTWYAAVEGWEDRRQHYSRQGGSRGELAVDGVGCGDGDGVGGCGSGRGGGDVGDGKASVVGVGAGVGAGARAAPTAIWASLADSPSINAHAVAGGSGSGGEGGGMHATDGEDRKLEENSEEKDQPFRWKPATASTARGSAADPQEPSDGFVRNSGGEDQPKWRRRGADHAGSVDESFAEETGTEELGATDVDLSSRLPSPISFRVRGETPSAAEFAFCSSTCSFQDWPVGVLFYCSCA